MTDFQKQAQFTCKTCDRTMDFTEFYWRAGFPETTRCKECKTEYQRQKRETNPKYRAAQNRATREALKKRARNILYRIQFADGTFYIGATTLGPQRFNQHRSNAKSQLSGSAALRHALAREETPDYQILQWFETVEQLIEAECHEIEKWFGDELLLNCRVRNSGRLAGPLMMRGYQHAHAITHNVVGGEAA